MGLAGQKSEDPAVIDAVLEDFPRLDAPARPARRRAVRRRAAASGARPLPLRQAQARAPRRADRGHPALDHRGDDRDAAGASNAMVAVDDHRRAEPRLHHLAVGPGAGDPEGPDHRRGGPRSRCCRAKSAWRSPDRQPVPRAAGAAETDPVMQQLAREKGNSHADHPPLRRRGRRSRRQPLPVHVARGGRRIPRPDGRHVRRLRRRRRAARHGAAGRLSAHPRLPAGRARRTPMAPGTSRAR